MKKNLLMLSALGAVLLVGACSDEKVIPQRSPCVGLDDSPCGPKRPVNTSFDDHLADLRAGLV